MKKALAIILCVVMLVPMFCSTIVATDPLTWEGLAAATSNLAGVEPFEISQINTNGVKPNVDGYVDDGEYVLTQVLRDSENDMVTYRKSNNVDLPDFAYVHMNEDADYLYFAVEVEMGDLTKGLTARDCAFHTNEGGVKEYEKDPETGDYKLDGSGNKIPKTYNMTGGYSNEMIFVLNPLTSDVIPNTLPSMESGTMRQYRVAYRYDVDFATVRYAGAKNLDGKADAATAASEIVPLTNTEAFDDRLVYEFAFKKSELKQEFALGDDDITGFTYGFRMDTYFEGKLQTITNTTGRHGYGYAITDALKNAVTNLPLKKTDDTCDWNDSNIYVKTDSSLSAEFTTKYVSEWEDLIPFGLPYTTLASNGTVPTIDGVINDSEYAQRMTLKDADTDLLVYNKGAAANLLPEYAYVYMNMDDDNFYFGIKIQLDNNINDIRLPIGFSDSPYIDLPTFMKAHNNTTYSENPTVASSAPNCINICLGFAADGTSGSHGAYKAGISGSSISKELVSECAGTIATDAQSRKYTSFELVIPKYQAVREFKLASSDIKYFNYGIWINSMTDDTTGTRDANARIGYGWQTDKMGALNLKNKLLNTASSGDWKKGYICVKVLDSTVEPSGVDYFDLDEHRQKKLYVGSSSAAPVSDGTIGANEYAYNTTVKAGNRNYGVIAGGAQSGSYFKLSMDHDNDYLYIGMVVNDPGLVIRRLNSDGTYQETDAKKWDYYCLKLSFDKENITREIELYCFVWADSATAMDYRLHPYLRTIGTAETPTTAEKAGTLWGMTANADGIDYSINQTKKAAGSGSCAGSMYTAATGETNTTDYTKNDTVVFEMKLSKADIAEAYYGVKDASLLDEKFLIKFIHQGYKYNTETADDLADVTGGHGIKWWTGHDMDSDTMYVDTGIASAYGVNSKMNGYGHVVVLKNAIATSNSASIRLTDGSSGMRFMSTVDKATYDKLVETYDNVCVGTVITPKLYVDYLLERDGKFTKGDLDTIDCGNEKNYLDLRTIAPYKTLENQYVFVGSIANIYENHYDFEYAAIGYIEYYNDGEDPQYIYSNTYATRSVEQVAEKALADYSDYGVGYTNANYDIKSGIVVYTPYTAVQRAYIKDKSFLKKVEA